MVSVAPMLSICFALRMSTGTAFSASAPGARDPTVTSSANDSVIATSWVIVPGVSLIWLEAGARPGNVVCISTSCPFTTSPGMFRV